MYQNRNTLTNTEKYWAPFFLATTVMRWTALNKEGFILFNFSSLYLSNGYCLRRAISKLEGAIPECLLEPTYFVPC